MKGSSRMVRGMVKASIITKMVMSMKGFTKEIWGMDKTVGWNIAAEGKFMLGGSIEARRMAKGYISLRMEMSMRVCLLMVSWRIWMQSSPTRTDQYSKDQSWIVSSMGKVKWLIAIMMYTKECERTIRDVDKQITTAIPSAITKDTIRDNGKMINAMAMVNFTSPMVRNI